MRVAVAIYTLAGVGGTETYAVTVAEHLQRLGHDVWMQSPEGGLGADLARRRGLRVRHDVPAADAVDVALTNDAAIAYDLADRLPGVPQVHVAHSAVFDLQLPADVGQLRSVVVLHAMLERRIDAMRLAVPTVRLRQPIDTQRFRPTSEIRRTEPRVLLLGNYLHGERRALVAGACADLGYEVVHLGAYGSEAAEAPEVAINDADVVVGRGRVPLEAMACARAAFVLDDDGGDGWATPATFDRFAAENFSGELGLLTCTREGVRAALAEYDPGVGLLGRDYVCAHHAAEEHAVALVEALEAAAGQGTPGRPESDHAFELARLTRIFHRADADAFLLRRRLSLVDAELHAERSRLGEDLAAERAALHAARGDADGLRHRLDEARRTVREKEDVLAHARTVMAASVDTRRWRALQAALGPLDRLRLVRRRGRT